MIKEKLTQYIEDTIKENWDINAFADYGKDRSIIYLKEVQFIKEIKSLFAAEILLIGL